MANEKDGVRALPAEELDVVSGGAILRLSYLSAQSFGSSRLDWVALNPQPLPPRWLKAF